MINTTLAQEIYDNALKYGFENCGIIPLSDLDGYEYPWAKALIICAARVLKRSENK